VIGRFISADTIVPYPLNPQSLNRYSYCRNNPMIYVDPSGHFDIQMYPEYGGGLGYDTAVWGDGYWRKGYTGGDNYASVDANNPATNISYNGSSSGQVGPSNNLPATSYIQQAQYYIDDYGEMFFWNPEKRIYEEVEVSLCDLPIGGFGKVASLGLNALSKASKYGIKPYGQLIKDIKGSGLQAHKLIEKRFIDLFPEFRNFREIPSIAVTKSEHQVFTNQFRRAFSYGKGTKEATKTEVINELKEIYKNYPEIMMKLGGSVNNLSHF